MSNFAKPLNGVWAQRVANQPVVNQTVVNQTVVNQPVVEQSDRKYNNSYTNNQSDRKYNNSYGNKQVGHRYTVMVKDKLQNPLSFSQLNEETQTSLNTAQEYLTNLCVVELKNGLETNSDLQCMDYLTKLNVRLYVDGSNVVVGDYTFNCNELVRDMIWVKKTRDSLRKLVPNVLFNFFHNSSSNKLIVTVSC